MIMGWLFDAYFWLDRKSPLLASLVFWGILAALVAVPCWALYHWQSHALAQNCARYGWQPVSASTGYGSFDFCVDEQRVMHWPN